MKVTWRCKDKSFSMFSYIGLKMIGWHNWMLQKINHIIKSDFWQLKMFPKMNLVTIWLLCISNTAFHWPLWCFRTNGSKKDMEVAKMIQNRDKITMQSPKHNCPGWCADQTRLEDKHEWTDRASENQPWFRI